MEVNEILNGNVGAFESIIERYKNKLYVVTLRMVGDDTKAEKIVAASFIAAYQKLSEFKETEYFSDWFYRETVAFIKKEILSSSQISPEDYIQFYNPRFLEIEEAITSLEGKYRFEFLLAHSLREESEKLAVILQEDVTHLKENYQKSLGFIRAKLLENNHEKPSASCLTLTELTQYFDIKLNAAEIEQAEDHLEFCPSCREILYSLKVEKKAIEDVIHSPKLEEPFNRSVLSELTPYIKKVPKHRTWKYQLSVISVIAAIFFVSVVVVPALKPLALKLATYMEHGTIYNVWTEGTYKVTDNEVTFEVTGVEIDPLHMVVYYDVSSEKHNINYINDMDIYEYNAIKIVDEEGKNYPVEVSQPISDMFYGYQEGFNDLDEELKRPSFMIKVKKEEELPDKFTLHFQLKRIQGFHGSWEVEVPIHYDKIDSALEVVELDEVIVVDDKIEVELMTMVYGKYGSRLTYHARFTEDEKKRIESLEEETSDNIHEYNSRNQYIHAGIQVVNQDNQFMLPIYYHTMDWGQEGPIQMDFSRYFLNKETYSLKGKEEERGQYYAELIAVQYDEPMYFSLAVPLEETKEKPLDVELDGIILKNITIELISEENRNRYKVLLTGENKNDGDKQRHYNWQLGGDNNPYLETHYMGHYEENPEGDFEFLNVEISVGPNETENLIIKADNVNNYYMFEEGEKKIQLFKNGE